MAEPLISAYLGIVEPDAYRQLRNVLAKTKWYGEQHKKRWERRYNKPFPECKGEFGTIDGFRWTNA